MAQHLDLTLTSDLRMVKLQIDGLRGMLRPGFVAREDQIALLVKASADLGKTIAAVETWLAEIRAEKFKQQTASHKAALSRTLRAGLRRR